MQRRNVQKVAAANADEVSQVSPAPTSTIKKTSTTTTTSNSPSISSSTATNATATATPSADADDLRSSTRFILLRSFLLVAIFLILFTFTQNHILTPYFQPERTAAYQAKQQAAMKQQIARHVCPDGEERKGQI